MYNPLLDKIDDIILDDVTSVTRTSGYNHDELHGCNYLDYISKYEADKLSD